MDNKKHPFKANYMDFIEPKRGVYFNININPINKEEKQLITQYNI